jgi:hypothetical protein
MLKKIIFNYWVASIFLLASVSILFITTKIIGFVITSVLLLFSIINFIVTFKSSKKIVNPYNNEVDTSKDVDPKYWVKESKSNDFIVLKYKKGFLNLKKIDHFQVLKVCQLMLSHDYLLRCAFEDAREPYFYFQRTRAENIEMYKQ